MQTEVIPLKRYTDTPFRILIKNTFFQSTKNNLVRRC